MFEQFLARQPQRVLHSEWMQKGELSSTFLDFPHGGQRISSRIPKQKPSFMRPPPQLPQPIVLKPGESFVRKENSGDGYYSCGWLFAGDVQFDYQKAVKMLANLNVKRLKGLLKTNQGNCMFNDDDGVLNVDSVVGSIDSIIEIIHDERMDWLVVEQQLLAARC